LERNRRVFQAIMKMLQATIMLNISTRVCMRTALCKPMMVRPSRTAAPERREKKLAGTKGCFVMFPPVRKLPRPQEEVSLLIFVRVNGK
jgi:hypothetical protein